jgi:P-type Ca2+ transporter type 2C
MNAPAAHRDSTATIVAHAMSTDQVLGALAVDTERGLSAERAAELLAEIGPNELVEAPPVPIWRKLLRQFSELVVLILIAAAIVAGALGEWTESVAILAIVVLNGLIGFFQEHRAEHALAALRRMAKPSARVIRGGQLLTVATSELVPGDVIQLEAGDQIPADCRLLYGFGLRVQEAALTGESVPVDKHAQEVLAADTSLADRCNMVYAGTDVAAGKGRAVVVATGMNSELGRIAGMIERTEPEPTPLERRLSELGRLLVVLVLAVIAVVFTLRMLRGGTVLDVFLLSVSLAVAAVPEGLPAVVTIALALGLQRMVKRNALIRRLSSVETLGSVTVICSDKTGTLTRNEMTVREMIVGDGQYEVTGVGYTPEGEFWRRPSSARVDPRLEPDLLQALTIGAWCNDARVTKPRDGGEWQMTGDPTEAALVVAALKADIDPAERGRPVHEVPFDSERKMMSVVVPAADGSRAQYAKGAPEVVLTRCVSEQYQGAVRPLTDERRVEIRRQNSEMAGRAMRVLGLAYRPLNEHDEFEENELTFVGLAGMIDPPRDEVKEAVHVCHAAGLRPVMITGDHPTTARAIARELQIMGADDRVVTGQELDAIPDVQLSDEVERIAVYARVAAEHKVRVVRAWKQRGQVVAMTGDGVNDAPAVKAADIGIAMGLSGSDVTREASAMVLLDDNFASIVNAVEEGRTIYDNIQKVVRYLLSSNASEVLLVFVAALMDWPTPILAVQLLWLNLVSDSFPALALSMEPPERDVMQRPPRPPREPVVTRARGLAMFAEGSLMAAMALVAFAVVYRQDPNNLPQARTATFCVLAFTQLFFAIACRSRRFTMPELGLFSNPQLFFALAISGLLQLGVVTLPFARPIFGITADLTLWQWGLVLGLSLVPVSLIEIRKIVSSRKRG